MGSGVTFESSFGHFGVRLPESLLRHFWVTLILFVFLWSLEYTRFTTQAHASRDLQRAPDYPSNWGPASFRVI